MSLSWSASMITPYSDLGSAPLFRKEIELDAGHGSVESAVLHVSSLGVFEAAIDGHPVGSDVLADDIYDGQTIDARRRNPEWYTFGGTQRWVVNARLLDFDTAKLVPYVGPPVRRQEVLAPV